MAKQMNPLKGDGVIKFEDSNQNSRAFSIDNARMIMHQNLFFNKDEIKWYTHFNRYGFIDPYNTDQVCREFLFFTKPDLYIFDGKNISDATLNESLSLQPFFRDAVVRHKNALAQLQYSIADSNNKRNPFMSIFTNAATGKMDLPTIQADMQQSTPNIYGTAIDYRSHSFKSDNSFDFSISFMDTAYLDIYTIAKAYDEYMRLVKIGDIKYDDAHKDYIIARVIPEQFSVYKFLIGSDGETILYYSKATGVFFVDVPRADFGDPGNDGFKYSLSFHANFVEDNNPLILAEFNKISPAGGSSSTAEFIDVFNAQGMNNSWARYPCIISAQGTNDLRVSRRGTNVDYRLKWTDADNPYGDNVVSLPTTLTTGNRNGGNSASRIPTNVSNASSVPIYNPNYYNDQNYSSAGLRIGSDGSAVYKLYDDRGNYVYQPTTRIFTI